MSIRVPSGELAGDGHAAPSQRLDHARYCPGPGGVLRARACKSRRVPVGEAVACLAAALEQAAVKWAWPGPGMAGCLSRWLHVSPTCGWRAAAPSTPPPEQGRQEEEQHEVQATSAASRRTQPHPPAPCCQASHWPGMQPTGGLFWPVFSQPHQEFAGSRRGTALQQSKQGSGMRTAGDAAYAMPWRHTLAHKRADNVSKSAEMRTRKQQQTSGKRGDPKELQPTFGSQARQSSTPLSVHQSRGPHRSAVRSSHPVAAAYTLQAGAGRRSVAGPGGGEGQECARASNRRRRCRSRKPQAAAAAASPHTRGQQTAAGVTQRRSCRRWSRSRSRSLASRSRSRRR